MPQFSGKEKPAVIIDCGENGEGAMRFLSWVPADVWGSGPVWTEERAHPGFLPHHGKPQSLEVQTLIITRQIGARPCGALVHDPTISIGRNGSSLTIFQPAGGLRALMLGALLSHTTQHFPCSSKGYKPKANPIVPHILIFSRLHKQFSSPSGMY